MLRGGESCFFDLLDGAFFCERGLLVGRPCWMVLRRFRSVLDALPAGCKVWRRVPDVSD